MLMKFIKTTFYSSVIISLLASPVIAKDYSDRLKRADKQMILQKYQNAEEQYKHIASDEKSPIVKAYIHYRLGKIYEAKQEKMLARQEWEKGLSSLEKSGKNKHPLNKFLVEAMDKEG